MEKGDWMTRYQLTLKHSPTTDIVWYEPLDAWLIPAYLSGVYSMGGVLVAIEVIEWD